MFGMRLLLIMHVWTKKHGNVEIRRHTCKKIKLEPYELPYHTPLTSEFREDFLLLSVTRFYPDTLRM